jgi:nicotinate dehydrogenase subunit A
MNELELNVNGVTRSFNVEPTSTLLSLLRDQCDLKGSRFGCGLGVCGACNVLVDGRAIRACDTPLWAVLGKSITTIEGLGTPESPHPLQEAFIAFQAMQCGYCASGIMISAAALLKTNPAPSEAEVRAALDDNLCRCGAHNRMVAAIMKAAEVLQHTSEKPDVG